METLVSFGESEPFGGFDFFVLEFEFLIWVGGFGEEEVDGLCDGIIFDWVAGYNGDFVSDDDIEADFFFDFAEGGFLIGFTGFLVALREATEKITVFVAGCDDENSVVVDNNAAAAGFFVHGIIITHGEKDNEFDDEGGMGVIIRELCYDLSETFIREKS